MSEPIPFHVIEAENGGWIVMRMDPSATPLGFRCWHFTDPMSLGAHVGAIVAGMSA